MMATVKITEAPFKNRSEALQHCRNLNLNVEQVGETQYKVSSKEHPEKGDFYLNDGCKDLPNHQRQIILFLIFCLGAPVVIGVLVWFFWPAIQTIL